MTLRSLAFPVRLLFTAFSRRGRPNWIIIAGILSLSAIQSAAVFGGAYIDGTWRLPGGGKGLLDHYGVWSILATDPLLLISTAYAYYRFRKTMATLPVCFTVACRQQFREIVFPHVRFLHLQANSIFVYLLFVVIGLLATANNIYQTIDPAPYFGNDVFDSKKYICGFLANKINLFNSWVIIYPAVGFIVLSMCISTRLILERVRKQKLILPIVTHPDKCYGLGELGTFNVFLMAPYLLAFTVIFALLHTHKNLYFSLLIPLFSLPLMFFIASYIVIKPILTIAKETELATYRKLVRQNIDIRKSGKRMTVSFATELFFYSTANGSPYSNNAKRALFVMRLIPLLSAGLSFVR